MMKMVIYCFVFSLLHIISAKNTAKTFYVAQKPGIDNFRTIQSAIDHIPQDNNFRVIIKVDVGIYTEKINIPKTKSFITIEGAGADNTVVQWGDTAGTKGPTGETIGTTGSATFTVNAAHFIAMNISFKNSAPAPEEGATDKQGVALLISGDAAMFIGCKFLGAQDTLYDKYGRHYFKDCFIEGSIDFIFGSARSLYEGCHIHSIAKRSGIITAQKRENKTEIGGFSFVHCKITGSGDIYLGRPWKGAFSLVVFSYTYMDNIIFPQGWNDWNRPDTHSTIFYAEYKCTGLGARRERRVNWSKQLNDKEAAKFISLTFINISDWYKFT